MSGNGDYISREAALEAVWQILNGMGYSEKHNDRLVEEVDAVFDEIPAADALPRDKAIKMGAELAAMHGSDATSQQLEEAYLKGVENGMIRRNVRPVVLCRDCTFFKPQQKSARWSSTVPVCSRSATIKMPPDGFCSFGVKREES